MERMKVHIVCPPTVSQSTIATEQKVAGASGPLHLLFLLPRKKLVLYPGGPKHILRDHFRASLRGCLQQGLSWSPWLQPLNSAQPLMETARPAFRLLCISPWHLTDMVYTCTCLFLYYLSALIKYNLHMLCSLLCFPFWGEFLAQ